MGQRSAQKTKSIHTSFPKVVTTINHPGFPWGSEIFQVEGAAKLWSKGFKLNEQFGPMHALQILCPEVWVFLSTGTPSSILCLHVCLVLQAPTPAGIWMTAPTLVMGSDISSPRSPSYCSVFFGPPSLPCSLPNSERSPDLYDTQSFDFICQP